MTHSEIHQEVFRALADPTRREIIELLADEPKSIGALVDQFEMTRAAVAKHLHILEGSGIITVTPNGRERINNLNPAAMRPVADWLAAFDRFWDDRLAKLKTAIEEDTHD